MVEMVWSGKIDIDMVGMEVIEMVLTGKDGIPLILLVFTFLIPFFLCVLLFFFSYFLLFFFFFFFFYSHFILLFL